MASFVSVTDANTVYDLEKTTTQMGISGGALGYGGIDLITFGQPTDNGDINGAQISSGVGAGMDIHIVSPATETIIKVR